MCGRLRVPNAFKSLALQVMQYHTHCHKAFDLRAATLVDVLAALGVFKAEAKFADFLLACEADARGRTGFEQIAYPQAERMKIAAQAAASVDSAAIIAQGLQGAKIGEALRRLRIKAVADALDFNQVKD